MTSTWARGAGSFVLLSGPTRLLGSAYPPLYFDTQAYSEPCLSPEYPRSGGPRQTRARPVRAGWGSTHKNRDRPAEGGRLRSEGLG